MNCNIACNQTPAKAVYNIEIDCLCAQAKAAEQVSGGREGKGYQAGAQVRL